MMTTAETANARTYTSTKENQVQRLLSERAALLRSIAVKVTAEQARVEEIENTLRDVLPFGETTVATPAGAVTVSKSPQRRINKDKATGLLRPGQFQRVSKRVLDTTAFRSQYPDLAEQCWDNHSHRLTWG